MSEPTEWGSGHLSNGIGVPQVLHNKKEGIWK